MENRKIAKTVVITDRILKVLQGFFRAFIIVSGIFIVLTLILGEKIVADATSLHLDCLQLQLRSNAVPAFSALKGSILMSLAAAIVILAVGLYTLRMLRSTLAPMKEGRPFAAGISAGIRKLAWVSLIGGAIAELCRMLGSIAELRAFNFSSLFNMENVASIQINYNFRLGFVAVFAILLFLSLIFRCGETLQQESDETL